MEREEEYKFTLEENTASSSLFSEQNNVHDDDHEAEEDGRN